MCPKCGGEIQRYGKVRRKVLTKYRNSKWITVQRYRCKSCGHVWRDLPDNILPYKQYEREMIEGVREGLIDSDILGFEEYPCEMTMKRWRGTQK